MYEINQQFSMRFQDLSTKNMPVMSLTVCKITGAWGIDPKAPPPIPLMFVMCSLGLFNTYNLYFLLKNNSQHMMCNEINFDRKLCKALYVFCIGFGKL